MIREDLLDMCDTSCDQPGAVVGVHWRKGVSAAERVQRTFTRVDNGGEAGFVSRGRREI